MNALRRLFSPEARGTTVVAVWALEGALAWSLALALGAVLAEPLRAHPDGVFALYGEGGRLLLDYARVSAAPLRMAALVAGAAVALWAVAGVLLGGVIPWVAASRIAIPTVPRAFAESVRRAPSLAALALMAGAGYGLAGLLGWYAWSFVGRTTARLGDARATDLRHAWVALAALAVAGLVKGWHGVARYQCLGKSLTARTAAVEAAGRLVREPVRTLGRGVAWGALGLVGTLLAFGAGALLERNPAGWAVALLTAAQQLSLLWRVHCRMKWFVGLAAD